MHVVLVEPEIPQNTGNISRTCACTDTELHLVGKLGFSTDDRYLKRAGLDYWQYLKLHYHSSIEELFALYPNGSFYFLTTKGSKSYADVAYGPDDFLVFGKETAGLPEELLHDNYDKCVRIPMLPVVRSLNLSNSVAIVLYEALRQQNFPGLSDRGKLTKF